MRCFLAWAWVLCWFWPFTSAFGQEGVPVSPAAGEVRPNPTVVVIGFVGGFVKHDNLFHSTVQLAADLRKKYPSGVYVEAFENHRRENARREILRRLDVDHDGELSAEEKQNARIILYGHSWGASEAVTLARRLQRDGIPVLLTIQVDSIAKPGENDTVIPANVEQAVNFYQPNGFLHGKPAIRAADPARTQILGNFQSGYKANQVRCERYTWFGRVFMKPHLDIECDPKVWSQVKSLINSKLAAAPPDLTAKSSLP